MLLKVAGDQYKVSMKDVQHFGFNGWQAHFLGVIPCQSFQLNPFPFTVGFSDQLEHNLIVF